MTTKEKLDKVKSFLGIATEPLVPEVVAEVKTEMAEEVVAEVKEEEKPAEADKLDQILAQLASMDERLKKLEGAEATMMSAIKENVSPLLEAYTEMSAKVDSFSATLPPVAGKETSVQKEMKNESKPMTAVAEALKWRLANNIR